MKSKEEALIQESGSAAISFELPQKHAFTVQEVAEILDVNHKTIRELIGAEKIQAMRLGRLIRIPRSEVLKLLGQ